MPTRAEAHGLRSAIHEITFESPIKTSSASPVKRIKIPTVMPSLAGIFMLTSLRNQAPGMCFKRLK